MSKMPDQPEDRPEDLPLEPEFPTLEPEPELDAFRREVEGETEPEPVYNGAEMIGETGEIELEPAGDVAEPLEPEPEPQLAAADYGMAAAGAAGAAAGAAAYESAGRRQEAARSVRTKTLREVGQLWGGVFFAADRMPPKVVTVTSAMRREGVTQIAAALAMCGAATQNDGRVCLVDGNLRHSRVSELLRIEATPGLSDVLLGRATLSQALQTLVLEENRELAVLTAGEPDSQPLGLLRSRQLKAVFGMLRDRFDYIVIDAPATNLYADPQILGSLSDGVLIVIHSGRTRRESVAEAKKRLELARARFLGVVLNQRTYPIPSFLYRRL